MGGSSSSRTNVTLLARLRLSPTDQGAWQEFVQRYGPKIYGWCRRWNMQDADAQDVAQMVLLRLAAQMQNFKYDPTRSFRAWLKSVTHHALSDFATSRKNPASGSNGQADELLDSLQARDDLAERLEHAYDLELLDLATSRVRLRVQAQTWEAFQLTALDGLSGAAAAEQLKIKITSVYKAKSNVQKLIQEEIRYLEGPASS